MNTGTKRVTSGRLKAVAFDLDSASLIGLHEALPEWEIEVLNKATAASLTYDWNPGEADLLVVNLLEVGEALRLCRFLVLCGAFSTDSREQAAQAPAAHRSRETLPRRPDTLLVLVPSGQESLLRAVSEAGADGCLALPFQPREVTSVLARVRQGHRPERHALMFCLGRTDCENPSQRDGDRAERRQPVRAAGVPSARKVRTPIQSARVGF